MEVRKEIVVKNKTGLHARPAASFVKIANKFDSEIVIEKEDQKVNGKSIMGILMLGAQQYSVVMLSAEGDDADKLINEVEQFLSRNE